MKKRACFILLGFGIALRAAAAPAGAPFQNYSNQFINLANLDLSVPESPAFTALGLNPETVVRPASPRDFALSLLNGVDANGNFQSGVAIDVAPYLLWAGNDVTIKDYRSSAARRFLARSSVSVATAKGVSSGDEGTRLSVGFHFTIFDCGDPRLNTTIDQAFSNTVARLKDAGEFPPINPALPQEQIDAVLQRRTALIQTEFDEARKLAKSNSWNKSSMTAGAAPSWIDPGGANQDHFRWNGATIWASCAYGFEGIPKLERRAQFIAHIRYHNHEHIPDPLANNVYFVQDSLLGGVRLRFGKPDLSGSFEGGVVQAWPAGRPDDLYYKFGAAVDARITDGVWLDIALSKESENRNGKNDFLFLVSIKYGQVSKAVLRKE